MPLLRINAAQNGLALHDSSRSAARAFRDIRHGTMPIIVMVHGYRHDPEQPHFCPHKTIYADNSGWQHRFGFRDQHTPAPQLIAFGWPARGAFREAHGRAQRAGQDLAALIDLCSRFAPHRPVHVIAHSLGSEVVLNALPHVSPGLLRRVILLTGASHRGSALSMLDTPAGRSVETLNVMSRENDLFDLTFERIVPGEGAIGRGLTAGNVLNLQLDCAQSLKALAGLGFDVAHQTQRISHRSTYQRPGAMRFYANLLTQPDPHVFRTLKRVLPPTTAPHFSRLLPTQAPRVGRVALALAHAAKTRIMAPLTAQGSRNEHAY